MSIFYRHVVDVNQIFIFIQTVTIFCLIHWNWLNECYYSCLQESYENLSITGLRNGVMVLSKVLP